MASSEQELLREFLVRLRYDVDLSSQNKFLKGLAEISGTAFKVGGTILGLAGAVQAYVQVFASQMEKMYYASRRTKSSVESIQSMRYAAEQVGVSAQDMQGAIESFSKALRTNPGFEAWLNNMGITTKGRENTAIISDMIKQLQKLPHNVGAMIAESFGIPEETFLMLKDKLPEFMAAQDRLRAKYKELGYDAQQAAADSREYENSLRDLGAQVKVLWSVMAHELLPVFREVNKAVSEKLSKWTKYFGSEGKAAPEQQLKETPPDSEKAQGAVATAARKWIDFWTKKKRQGPVGGAVGEPAKNLEGAQSGVAPGGVSTPDKASANLLFNRLEGQFSLPKGLLDSMWAQESGRGKYMLSPKGAMGHLGFMPNTAKEYGLKNPNDLAESAAKAAEKMSNLLRWSGGDLKVALAGYNWGEGNLSSVGRELGRAPRETQNYVRDVTGRMGAGDINQEINITVQASGDPNSIADAVGREVKRNAPSEALRNMIPRVQ